MLGDRIKTACSLAGVSLKKGCEISGVKYGTLFSQIGKSREIPFSTVECMSRGLRIPLSFFCSEQSEPMAKPTDQSGWEVAEVINAERAVSSRAGFSVTTDHILDWFHQENGQLKNWDWFADQVDIYHPVEPTDSFMKPIRIGKRSLTTERLMLCDEDDFLRVVSRFDPKIISRAMWAHKSLDKTPYLVSDEILDVEVKGARVKGGYRKVSMRLIDSQGKPINAMFSKLTWLHSPKHMQKVS